MPIARRSFSSANKEIVAHGVGLGVGDRQGEAGPLQERADIADIGKGNDAGAGAAGHFALGRKQRFPQFLQGAATGNGGEEQAVGFQGPTDLDEDAGRVVGQVQR